MVNDLLGGLATGEGGPLGQLAKQFGLSPEQVQAAVGQLSPALTGAMQQNASKPGGREALQNALSSGNHSRYVDSPATLADPATTEDGNAILGHLLGSKDESRRVASQAAASTGIDAGILKQLLPLVATLVMGQMSKGGGGGLGSLLDGITGGGGGMLGGGASGGGGLLGGLLGKLMGRR